MDILLDNDFKTTALNILKKLKENMGKKPEGNKENYEQMKISKKGNYKSKQKCWR